MDSATGKRVKLQCANWPAHIGVMLAEGLDKQPIEHIVSQLPKLGLNCVRLTWATFMFTRYPNQTVQQALDSLGLPDAKKGIINNNPKLLNMTHPQAYASVVDELGAANIMVISDNHISEPKWCCAPDDGNAFFGDKNFDPKEWIQGLSMAAQLLKGKSNVVGVSLRNELRGPLQNLDGWYRNMTQGALAVHQANPNALVIISGFNNDNDLSFLKTNSLNLTLDGKLVYEVHSYPVSGEKKDWGNQSANLLCGKVKQELDSKAGFLTTGPNPAPLVLTEYGIDLIARTEGDSQWLNCILAYIAASDLDWAWWGLQGSYYLREGRANAGESYGLLTSQWDEPSFPEFPQKFLLVLRKLQGTLINYMQLIFIWLIN